MAANDPLSTGDFSQPVFNIDQYVEMSKIEARERIASREQFLDDKKRGIVYASPMKKGTYELNTNYESLHTDKYQDPGKLRTSAKIKAKETWLDEKKAGMVYSHPSRKSSTPGDAYSNISQQNVEAFPPFGTYAKRGVREKINVDDLKEFRNIQTSPAKKGMGGVVGHPGVLLSPFPAFVSGDDYDAMKKQKAADTAIHKESQAKVDEKCRFVSTSNSRSLFDSQANVDAPKVLSDDPLCLKRDPTAFESANPKEKAKMIDATMPWRETGDKTWRYSSPTKSWKYHTINKFPEHMPDKFDDQKLRECQTPLRRMGWHRHVASGAVSESIQDRKPFRPSTGVGHTKLSTSIMFRNMRV